MVTPALEFVDPVLHVRDQVVPPLDLNLQGLELVVELPLDVPQMVLDELPDAQEDSPEVFLVFQRTYMKRRRPGGGERKNGQELEEILGKSFIFQCQLRTKNFATRVFN